MGASVMGLLDCYCVGERLMDGLKVAQMASEDIRT